MTSGTLLDRLDIELESRAGRLRPPDVALAPATLGAARLTRYSFNRSMLRRAARDGWQARRVVQRLDDEGRGESVYEVEIGDRIFSFAAFTTTIDESEHTDRVIAERWEITAVLIEGTVNEADLNRLREEAPRQEHARFDPRVLVLTRGNRSVRFFQYLVDCLAAGFQPDPGHVGDSGYIMRSTAFYANGKYGMRSFKGYRSDHPFRIPYRAQFVAAWLFRELSYDVVEHCARAKGQGSSVGFDDQWRRFFGLGNATGLGLVPYAFSHPRVVHAWVAIREIALADARSLAPTEARIAALSGWIDRAAEHFGTGTSNDCTPFLSPAQLVSVVDEIRGAFDAVRDQDHPFDAFYRRTEALGSEACELAVSLLIELHPGDDDLFDELLLVDETVAVDPLLGTDELVAMIDQRFGWLEGLDLDRPDADAYWWVISDNTEEPRRVRRRLLAPNEHDVAIDHALRIGRLRRHLAALPGDIPVGQLLTDAPQHLRAVERVASSDRTYGEPRDNPCAATYLPLQVQRFQLAFYGMDNFKPKSTDWLRVTLYQGAPRIADLGPGLADDWVLPALPQQADTPGGDT